MSLSTVSDPRIARKKQCMSSFAVRLIRWQRRQGRHDLPWQHQDVYRVWLSEIMLQQTQVATVIPYYLRFVASFPNLTALAAATEEDVLTHWSGLGYYARGRNLLKAARIIATRYNGKFPRRLDDIAMLPGIGRSTAAAICALAYHERHAILDGNVKRVLTRYCGIEGWTGDKAIEARLWQQAEALLPKRDIAAYTQGLMDLGATLCTRSKPKCNDCPVQTDCHAYNSGRTGKLPAPRPYKVVPERHAVMLLLVHDNDILLEKRPPQGIWGGLWSLPQFDDEVSAKRWFMNTGLVADSGDRMAALDHTFTHFKLHITPLKIQLASKPLQVMQPGIMWLDARDALGAAIPAAVRAMLKGLCV